MTTNGGYKAKTTAAQVAIREYADAGSTVLMRVANGSDIEVRDIMPNLDSEGNEWREVAYGYQKHGYMMTRFIGSVGTSKNHFMIQTLVDFGNKTYVKGDCDLHSKYGDIHNIQLALKTLAGKYDSNDEEHPLMDISVDGNFGPKTETAVKNAQRFMGCDIDGKVGPHTKARLYYLAYNKGGWPLAEN